MRKFEAYQALSISTTTATEFFFLIITSNGVLRVKGHHPLYHRLPRVVVHICYYRTTHIRTRPTPTDTQTHTHRHHRQSNNSMRPRARKNV